MGEPVIFVLCGTPERGQIPVGHTAAFYRDTWAEGQEPGGGSAPTPGLFFPKRGFGKVWRENPDVQQCLGYATTSTTETAFPITVQIFQGGVFLLSDTPEGRFIYAIHTFARCNSCADEGDYERFAAAAP